MIHTRPWWAGMVRRGVMSMSLFGALIITSGCETDSWLDPSTVGRWERTPVVLPILETLDVIDEPAPYVSGMSDVQPEDLIPEVHEYVVGVGDVLRVTIFELRLIGEEDTQDRQVDELGVVRLPGGIGAVQVAGRTPSQIETDISNLLEQKDILKDASVMVVMLQKTQNTFSIVGEPRQGNTLFGTYAIPKPEFAMWDAISTARGISGQTRTLYVYRKVPLTAEAAAEAPSPAGEGGMSPGPEQVGKEPSQLIEEMEGVLEGSGQPAPGAAMPPPEPPGPAAPPALQSGLDSSAGPPKWVWVGGKWVKIQEPAAPGGRGVEGMGHLVTQRIIKVPYDRLLQGDMRYNIIIRPGDIIKVPALAAGNVYVSGAINRPGTYQLPGEKDLTIKLIVAAAGNLSPVAIPQRVDLIRRVAENQEAVVRLDVKKIFDGTEPDLFLKPNDHLNFGTNGWAVPLAVVRNGFRMTYGFGFILDRNFTDRVFGP